MYQITDEVQYEVTRHYTAYNCLVNSSGGFLSDF